MNLTRWRIPRRLAGLAAAILALAAVWQPARAGVMIGYWEDWSPLPLGSVSPNYDIVEIAFVVAGGKHGATIQPLKMIEDKAEFASDVKALQMRGQKVVLSIGGASSPNVQLLDANDLRTFESSLEAVIDHFGFDGIDIDLENKVLNQIPGDNDVTRPTTPTAVNLIRACRDLRERYGPNFLITMAPETADLDSLALYGVDSDTIGWGNYLSLIYGIRDILTYCMIQCYNSGPMPALDGKSYEQGSPDFDAAMADLMIAGFHMPNGQVFPPLRPDQVVIGVPGGFRRNADPAEYARSVLQAAQLVGSGTQFPGGAYKLRNPAGYHEFGGVMTWDINIDQGNGLSLSDTLVPYLHGIGPPATPSYVVAVPRGQRIVLTWSPAQRAATYDVYRSAAPRGKDQVRIATGIKALEYSDTTATVGTTYYYTVAAVNAAGSSLQSAETGAAPLPPGVRWGGRTDPN